jgi:hypothetical protein
MMLCHFSVSDKMTFNWLDRKETKQREQSKSHASWMKTVERHATSHLTSVEVGLVKKTPLLDP